jgi:hypothetical protein
VEEQKSTHSISAKKASKQQLVEQQAPRRFRDEKRINGNW